MTQILIPDNIIEIFKNLDLTSISNYCSTYKDANICNTQSVKDYLINRFIPTFETQYKNSNIFDILSIIRLLQRHPYYLLQDPKYKNLLKTDEYKRFIIDKWIAGNSMKEYFNFLHDEKGGRTDDIDTIINMILILYPIPETYENMRSTLNAPSKLNYIVYRSLALGYSDNEIINIINSVTTAKRDPIQNIELNLNTFIFIDYGRMDLFGKYNQGGYGALKSSKDKFMNSFFEKDYLTLVGNTNPITGKRIKIIPLYILNNKYPKLFIEKYLTELLDDEDFRSGYENGIIIPRDNRDDKYWNSYIGLLFKPNVTDAQLNQIDNIEGELNTIILGTLNPFVINHFTNEQNDTDAQLESITMLGIEYVWKILDMLMSQINDVNMRVTLYTKLREDYRYGINVEKGMIGVLFHLHSQGYIKW
ncbi:Hypothetical protein ORPV_1101 [Orpheovirus IHUMI-LCC2]|uniref:Uncharacterized protein n=1 Tax=Orpheovirus IHUMI-LCC2 TaxID=2023057 RepID=A0A2I2L625_9VIRU|nr:Hypothetical protein ORPV_1101 [Orpheovirus IHUMI-LCC2]SNW63005.1 Hypothetical protein ORPV_1101 [Orpheovirus IHUMI-LCC2]